MSNNTITQQFVKSIIKSNISDPDELSVLKRSFAKKNKVKIPTNIILLKAYYSMVKKKKISSLPELENLLRVRRVRSQSGVAVVAVLVKNFGCPGKCLYCPTEKDMPKSYLSNEPAVMRAIMNNFDPYDQVKTRLEGLTATGHPTDKIELIIIGGTFGSLSDKYRYEFVKRCFEAANNAKKSILRQPFDKAQGDISNDAKLKASNKKQCQAEPVEALLKQQLEKIQKINEKAKHRIVGITIETRPDYINEKEIIKLRELGVTRVELGVQSIYDDVLKLNKRGHDISQTILATKLLKDAGFKINYHLMPNLPGSSIARDKKMFHKIFSNENFQPDILKIYPTVVTKNSELYKWWKQGKYKPYSDKQLLDLLIAIKKEIPPYVRIMRLIRDIPSQSIIAGSKISNLRQIIEQKTRQNILRCRCIRCREVGKVESGKWKVESKTLKLIRRDYDASQGKEIFLSFEDVKNDKLCALLRLRIPSEFFSGKKHFIPALQNAAIIREIHTYGQLVPIAQKGKKNAQHIGLGKQLILEAERIAQDEFEVKKIAVISGVGVRDYYRKLGYRLENEYMVKNL